MVGETYEDVGAKVNEMEAAAVAYLEVALALGAFAAGVPGVVALASAENFVDIPVADCQQEEKDVDPVGEEVLLKALNPEEVAFALLEPMNQMALQLQHQEWFLHCD